jgi:hypothetical protein
MSNVKEYKVWIHIEGLDKNGDCIEGDSFHEPHELFCTYTLEHAEAIREFCEACVENLPRVTPAK